MTYQTLYRRWRPKTFDEMVGQSHITNTLKNEILTGRIAHAYIFTGTRGTGKTSTAKILSRAVNCLNPVDGNPCNECDVCKGIMNETILDVVEMDAASNNGVENIRDIIDQVRYSTASSKYKVYIIDEVHMLSSGAFNALLKTLEEPPAHVIFILATTEIHKVLPTILSRCQRFDFKNILSSDIASALNDIFKKENIDAESDAIEYIAELGNGSMRDALSIAEQCLAYKNNNLTYSDVTEILGTLDDTVLYDIASHIANSDTANVVVSFNECINKGKNPDNFAEGLLKVMRDILLYNLAPDTLELSSMKRSLLEKTAGLFSHTKTVRCIEVLSELMHDLKFVSSPRVLVECALVRLSDASFDDDAKNIIERLNSLEDKISKGKFNSYSAQTYVPATENTVPPVETKTVVENPQEKKAEMKKTSTDDVITHWNDVKAALQESGRLIAFVNLFGVEPEINGEELILKFNQREAMSAVSEPDNISAIENIVNGMFGRNLKIRCVFNDSTNEVIGDNNDIFNNLAKMQNNFPENFKID